MADMSKFSPDCGLTVLNVKDSTARSRLEEMSNSLGTASTKDAISVVTDSTDLVESGAVKDIVGWGNKNILDTSHGILHAHTSDPTALRWGYEPVTLKAGTYTISFVKNTNYDLYWCFTDNWQNVDLIPAGTTVTLETDREVFIRSALQQTSPETDFLSMFSNVQLERGSVATPYEPYHENVADTLRDAEVIDSANLWDEVWEYGSISGSDGTNISDSNYIRSKNYIPVDSENVYKIINGNRTGNVFCIYYNENKTHVGTSAQSVASNTDFSPNVNTAKYMRFTFLNNGNPYGNDVIFGYANEVTTYEPYYVPLKDVVPTKADKSDLNTKLAKTTVALDESSLVASKAYVVDEEFLINDILYRAKLPINQNGAIAIGTNCELAGSVGEQLKSINDKITILDNKVFPVNVLYAFHIDGNESDPLAKVKYLEDCAGFTPAYMDFQNGVFRYGSWSEDEFFMPKPCMLKYDGTVDYYLANHDFTKKADGITASDVADTAYAGNAMLEFGRDDKKIWYKIVPDSGDSSSFTVYIADGQVDEDFHCWSFINNQGILVPHFYLSIYNGSVISDVMRSISGQAVSKSLTGTAEREKARANNQGANRLWDIECFADFQLIEFLTWLISRSTDSQKAFGTGLTDSGSEAINNDFRTGVHNAKGLFYGTNSGAAATYTNAVKVFGKENLWGFQWRRLNGWCMYDGIQKIKLTKGTQDGSTATDYNDDGTNYLSMGSGSTPSGSSGGYCKNSLANANAVVPQGVNGNSVSHYCDGLWFNNSGARLAHVGGDSSDWTHCGVSCAALARAVSVAYWYFGASLSCKPLA